MSNFDNIKNLLAVLQNLTTYECSWPWQPGWVKVIDFIYTYYEEQP